MTAEVSFYFDFMSPYSYLAVTQLPEIAARAGAEIVFKPVLLPELMKMVDNRPTTLESKAKGDYAAVDVARWAARYKVPIRRPSKIFSFDFALLGRGALVATDAGRAEPYVTAVYRAIWAENLDLTDQARLAGVLDKAGFDGRSLLGQATDAAYRLRLDEGTAEAAKRGVFGSPTFIVGEDMFWGNDRLDFVAAALSSNRT